MTEPLWGGRFGDGPDPQLRDLTASIGTDIRLLPYELAATKAHARSLVKAGLLDASDASAVEDGCDRIAADFAAGSLRVSDDDEDVHSFVERVLTERLGEPGRRIHAGRSRNDLVATGFRLWSRDAARDLTAATAALIEVLTEIADGHLETVMPGYTHLQRAQPVTLAFHLAAHASALLRDAERFRAAGGAADTSVLGAGALATSTLPIDPEVAASELGFEATFTNALDAVSDRDFAADLVFACALCGIHLSRLAEEIVLWTSAEFSFARLSDAWSTGSSMMPQKRNPDMAELIRGRAAVSIGDLTSLLGALKGLPLAYNRDLQEDKAIVFAAVDRTLGSLQGMRGIVAALTFDTDRMEEAARGGSAWATDAAEALVARRVPFRDAHRAVGELVAHVESGGAVDAATLTRFHPELREEDVAPDALSSVKKRSSQGGPAPAAVAAQLDAIRKLARSFR